MVFTAYEEYKKKRQEREAAREEARLRQQREDARLRQEREDTLRRQERERIESRLGPVLAEMSESERDRILRVVRGEPGAR